MDSSIDFASLLIYDSKLVRKIIAKDSGGYVEIVSVNLVGDTLVFTLGTWCAEPNTAIDS